MAESKNPTSTTGRCTVVAGEWVDPYTGRSTRSPGDLQIDHLVALGDAHRSGGRAWPPERKIAFANDLDDAEQQRRVGSRERAQGR